MLRAICDAFWGAKFGMPKNALEVRWLFNGPTKATAATRLMRTVHKYGDLAYMVILTE